MTDGIEVKQLEKAVDKAINEGMETKAHLAGIEPVFVPIGVTSFADLDAMEEAQEIVEDMKDTTTKFAEMSENIFFNSEIEDKAAALQALATEFATRIQQPMDDKEDGTPSTDDIPPEDKTWQPLTDKVTNVIKSFFGKDEPAKEDTKKIPSFDIWENKETGRTHWIATYSNNIIDKEQDIISSDSHRRFVEMVDKGLAPLPELWLWHRPEWKWGQATAVAYDESGFAIATGLVDNNDAAKELALWVKERDDILTSHGMPKLTVKRSDDNPNVITEHTTREVSPLFKWKAANELTNFSILKESTIMKEKGILEEKRQELIDNGVSPDTLAALEQSNQGLAKETDEAGLAKKEEPVKEKAVIAPVEDDLKQTVMFLAQQVATLANEVKELKTAKVEKEVSELPVATMLAGVQGLFDQKNALAKKEEPVGVTETPVPANQPQTLIHGWMAQDAGGNQ